MNMSHFLTVTVQKFGQYHAPLSTILNTGM